MLPDTNLTQMVKRLFADADGALRAGEIYDAIEGSFPLSVSQKEYTRYDEPLFHQEIRAIINQLMRKGEIIRVYRGENKKSLKCPHAGLIPKSGADVSRKLLLF